MGEARGKARIIGLGMDNSGQDFYYTKGEGYRLLKGSKETHRRMQERIQEFLRLVAERGLSLDNISRSECGEIMSEMGMALDTPA